MSHIRHFQEELSAVENLMQMNPEKYMEFQVYDVDPRDVPEDYTMTCSESSVWFTKKIGKSTIDLNIDAGYIVKGQSAKLNIPFPTPIHG